MPIVLAGCCAASFALVLGTGWRHAGFGWEAASLLVTLAYPLALVVGAAYALGARENRGLIALLPALLLAAGFPGIAVVRSGDASLHDRRFVRHLGEVEALVAGMPLERSTRTWLPADSLPPEVRDCCARLVFVRRDDEGRLSATFVGRRSTAYLYDPSGARLERGLRLGRWRSHQRLAQDWYRVVRF